MRRLCGSESRMGASVELRVRGEASLLQRARTCDNRRRGGSGDDGGNGGRAMTTWERWQQFDSLPVIQTEQNADTDANAGANADAATAGADDAAADAAVTDARHLISFSLLSIRLPV
jgi:hypothetical protein